MLGSGGWGFTLCCGSLVSECPVSDPESPPFDEFTPLRGDRVGALSKSLSLARLFLPDGTRDSRLRSRLLTGIWSWNATTYEFHESAARAWHTNLPWAAVLAPSNHDVMSTPSSLQATRLPLHTHNT